MSAVENPSSLADTTSVGLRELKQHLSAYVHRAERGETILITDRGVVIAELHPASDMARILQAVADGRLDPPKNGWGGLRRTIPHVPLDQLEGEVLTTKTALELLDEDRGE